MAVQKKTKKIIIASIVLASLLLIIFLAAPFTIGTILYDSLFNVRYETNEYSKYYVADFEGLKADRHEFTSYKGTKLVGYRYYMDSTKAKGVVVIAHGFGGGGHNVCMDVAYYFTKHGYDVFSYDVTGNDESDGEGTIGFPQGVADLNSAIDYLKKIEEVKDLPVMLFGHSWGGYSVCSVLNYHPEVKAVAAISGFNHSGGLIKAQGQPMVGEIMGFLMPYINSIEKAKCGKYSSANALDGFANSKCGVLIAHSGDDPIVPIKCGYDLYYNQYADDERFEFIRYEDKGHFDILYSEERTNYMKKFNEEFQNYFGGQTPTPEEHLAYYKEHLDRKIYCNGLNAELFDRILNLYNSNL